jgi:uncharacterized phage protein (TIGR01671 family)
MRTIKFRGKDFAGTWWYGYPSLYEGNPVIHPLQCVGASMLVDEDSVGQFTGLTDKNGKEIYEGDIVQWGDSEHKIKQVVEFRNGAFGYVYDTIGSFVPYAANTNFDFAAVGTDKRFEVVGNIHDNPELLEGGNQ